MKTESTWSDRGLKTQLFSKNDHQKLISTLNEHVDIWICSVNVQKGIQYEIS